MKLAYEKFPEEREHIGSLMDFEKRFPSRGEVVRTEEYVAAECKRLAEQLKEFEK